MTVLSAQSIDRLCRPAKWFGLRKQIPMIEPFVDHKVIRNGMSYGLSGNSYDVRIDKDITLGPNPAAFFWDAVPKGPEDYYLNYHSIQDVLLHTLNRIKLFPPHFVLANTFEFFNMPDNVCAEVADKSTYARGFVSVFNTMFDAGFRGNATLELINHTADVVCIKAGTPICQLVFKWLDRKTDRPYNGKYQFQTNEPHPPRYEDLL